ncbi:MAG: hypothetical protein COB02_06280 [Candidatus Cloacimonadota bacterium]|nr:MAG: hypothetical protein COB02_06280 [Candidatus Cloacimonadota bacterium]
MKTLYLYIFIFCPWVIYAESLRHEIYGDITTSYFTGKEEFYRNTDFGDKKIVSDLSFRNTELNLGVDLSKTIKKLNLNLSDQIYGDILSKKNTRTRFSSYNNLLKFKADFTPHQDLRLHAAFSADTYEDQSFKEFSHGNNSLDLKVEKRLQLETFIGIGTTVSNTRFEYSPRDSFDETDFYLSYFRFSQEKHTMIKEETIESSHVKFILMEGIKESTRRKFSEAGYLRTLANFQSEKLKPNLFIYRPYKLQSDMSFDLEYRVRHRELYNSLEKSYLEQQVNGALMFYLSDDHSLRFVNHYADREYSKDSIADRLFSHRKNQFEITHNIQTNKIYLSSGLLLDYIFHKDKEDFDQHDVSIDFDISWDIMPGWNFAYNYSNLRKSYDKVQEYFTNYRQIHGNLTVRADINRRASVMGSFFSETKRYNQFVNQVDSPYDRIGQDYRFIVNPNQFWSWHIGYKWEEEEHSNFITNNRFERLAYLGTKFSL